MNNSREKFELKISMEYEQPPCLDRDGDGYDDSYVDNAWWGWQAATEQSQKEIAGLEAKLNELVKFQSSADRLAMDILDVITDYFGVGGLFNPELMEHDKVSNMVEMARAEITSLRAELEKAKKDGERNSWMVKHNAYISWSQDSEVCNVWIAGDCRDDKGDYPAQGYPQKSYNTVEEAIDNAMKGKE